MGIALALASLLVLQSPVDEAALAKRGFAKLDESGGKPTLARGGVSYRRAEDSATLQIAWVASSEVEAKQAWKNVLSNMAGLRKPRTPLPPSGKAIGEDWLFVGGKQGGVWRIDALKRNTYVSVMLHYRGGQVDGEIQWTRTEGDGDGKLVEEIVRAIQAQTVR